MMMGLALAAVISLVQPCLAQPITYDFVNYASLQDGDTVSGSITTDGAIGALAASDITAWSVTVTGPLAPFSISSTDSKAALTALNMTATQTQVNIYAPLTGNLNEILFTGGDGHTGLHYIRSNDSTGTYDFYDSIVDGNLQWGSFTAGSNTLQLTAINPWLIATAVPEPSSALLAAIGGVLGLVVAVYRKRK